MPSTDQKHIKRWIKASFVKIARTQLEQGVDLFVEGEDRTTNKTGKFMELRIDGPYTTPCGTIDELRSYVEINLLGNSTRNEANVYDRENLQGLLAFILNRDFCVYRTGNEGRVPEDDGTLFGTMLLIPHDAIKTSDFGMVDPNTEVYQCVCEAHFEMYHGVT